MSAPGRPRPRNLLTSGRSLGTPAWDSRAAARYAAGSASNSAFFAAGTGPLWAGREKFGVRWNTVSSAACRAMSGIDWIPDEPVPMTATRSPEKSTPACGHRPVK